MVEAKQQATAPRWDLTPFFPGVGSRELEAELEEVVEALGELEKLFDEHGIRKRDTAEVDEATVAAYETVTERLNTFNERQRTVYAYLHGHVTTDSRDDLAQSRLSELQAHLVAVRTLGTRYEAWVGSLDADALIERSDLARAHAFAIRKAQVGARHQMTEDEERLAAELQPAGQTAWSKLHGNVTSRLMVPVRKPDGEVTLPMASVRGLAHDPDRGVREAAYRAEMQAWPTVEVPLTAALNSIKGWQNTLNRRRGWSDPLEPALFANHVDRATLDAMQEAVVESFPDFRRYLGAKARLLGVERLAWWDLFAPVGGEVRRWPYDEGAGFIVERFGGYSDALAGLADRAFRESWIDAEPREGKRDGGFCMPVRADESRILVNHTDDFGSVSTVAHELGHAYHNTRLAERTPLQRQTPMALAETASIFCQTIVMNAMLAEAAPSERVAILEGELQHACQIVVDIHSRFLFERAVFEGRERRELSAGELCERMLEAQRATYGDGVDPDTLHPYMWAVKPHYYSTSFYNWPYTFGFLFGLGLYARYEADPEGFRGGYDDLLASTGLDEAATLAARFDIDIRDAGFWRSSLDIVRERISDFEGLVA